MSWHWKWGSRWGRFAPWLHGFLPGPVAAAPSFAVRSPPSPGPNGLAVGRIRSRARTARRAARNRGGRQRELDRGSWGRCLRIEHRVLHWFVDNRSAPSCALMCKAGRRRGERGDGRGRQVLRAHSQGTPPSEASTRWSISRPSESLIVSRTNCRFPSDLGPTTRA